MQLRYWKNAIPAEENISKISSTTWSLNGKRLAVAAADRVVYLFDEAGEKKDKFPTKASDKGQKSYIVRCMEFSPDSQKIAIGQSDNIVFVYKLGEEWGEKKSICNKFPASASVTAMTWPKEKNNDLYYGLADGKVRVGTLRNNKSQVLYSGESYVLAMSSARNGVSIISGHLDGSILGFNTETSVNFKVGVHHCPPTALAFGQHIVAAGNDGKVSFYSQNGNLMQRFDYTNDDKIKEFGCASTNPSGDTVVLGNFNRFYVYNFNRRRGQWEDMGAKIIENYYSVTSSCWKGDGSKLVISSLCGSCDIFDISMKKIRYKGKFEINYVSSSQVVIQTIATKERSVVKSGMGSEITRVNIFQDRYVVANTFDSLLLGDMATNKISEIPWRGSGNEKFDFGNPGVCMIFNVGELIFIEYGNNEPIGTCRTEFMKNTLISVRVSHVNGEDSKRIIAFMLDQMTICIQDLSNSMTIANISHDLKVDFLELNAHANKLLFRDIKRQLYLYDVKAQAKKTLLNFCNFVQWVPDSEVVVAQNRNSLCVWYSIENPDKVTLYSIKGDIDTIERHPGKTEVIVNEGNNVVAYTLDEPLIEFGFALESRDLDRAANILHPLEMNPETESNWKTLARLALEEQNITVAEHCFAALGDIAKAAYLRKISKLIRLYEKETGRKDGLQYYKVQARLAILDKQFSRAEALFLDYNDIDEAMGMYQELHKWDDSIKIAEKKNHPEVKQMKNDYLQWLLQTGQEAKAGELKERDGELLEGINLYLQGGVPAKAANVVFSYNVSFPQDVLERIATALSNSGMWEKAGEFFEQMEMLQKSLDAYCKGNAYKKAVMLAKRAEPKLVITLEERWGDWLVSQKQTESAINHYIEAGAFQKAIESAISSRQWNKAVQLVSSQSPEIARPFYKQIAKHYADVRQHDLAEKYYLKAGQPVEAFEMYALVGKWELAQKVAKDNLPETESINLYIKIAKKFELASKFAEAEKLYLTVNAFDNAINMYNSAGQFENVIRLVGKHRRDHLKDTHLKIAQKLETDGNLKSAENHYVEATQWHGAVQMYRTQGLWEEAIRVCRTHGSDKETSELAKKWAENLGPEAGMQMLLKMNLVDAVIEYLIERKEFDEAFKMASVNAKHKTSDVHLQYAMHLEDENRLKEAEEHYIKAGKASEAVNMYEHQGDFHSAIQIAKQHDPAAVPGILVNQGKAFYEKRDYSKAEGCFVAAKRADFAIRMYSELGNFQEALKVAKKHAPHLVNEINNKFMKSNNSGDMSGEELMNAARVYEESREYLKAIETYLEIKREHFPDSIEILEESWVRAVQLSMNFEKERCPDVTRIVAKRLKDIKRFEIAGDLLENIGLYEEAVSCYITGNLFEKAKACAESISNPSLHDKLMEMISTAYKSHLKNQNRTNELVNYGEVSTGLDMMFDRGEWIQCLETAKQQSPEILNRYLLKYAKKTMEEGQFGDAAHAFAKYGAQAIPVNFPFYKTLALEIFVDCQPDEIHNLRTMLAKLMDNMSATSDYNSPAGKEFARYLQIAHLVDFKNIYKEKGLHSLYARVSIALLRYCDVIRLDKLFYDAGMAARKENWLSMAFVFLNRYLDIYETIEDPDSNNFGEEEEFKNTDIPSPFDVAIPENNLISDKDKEAIRDWVLQISINQKVEQSLPSRKCHHCNTMIYEACLKCPVCKMTEEPCIVTGYPLSFGEIVMSKNCGKGAIKEFWNLYMQHFSNCSWCSKPPN